MDIDRKILVEAVIGAGAFAFFLVTVYVISQLYGTQGNGVAHLQPTGGMAVVASIVLFVLVTTGAGFWLEAQEFDS